MLMPDVNILVYAHREESPRHSEYAQWLTRMAVGKEPFALSELVLSGFLRVVTNPKIFRPPSTLTQAFEFLQQLINQANCRLVRPGERHWEIFRGLCQDSTIYGKRIADAYHAALAIEQGCEWVSADTDFALFQDQLRWQHV